MEASTSPLLRVPLPLRRSSTERRPRRVHVAAGFAGEGHFGYYAAPIRCGEKEKKKKKKKKGEKKRAKLADSLSKDLAAFMDLGFGLEEEDGNQEKISLSEAAEVLLTQLGKVRAKEKEMKRKKKKEKECMTQMACDDSSSSSSDSSDSSDSECEDVIEMRDLRAAAHLTMPVGSIADGPFREGEKLQMIPSTQENGCPSSNMMMNTVVEARLPPASSAMTAAVVSADGKIEVCMGGKCKKTGALQLIEEFERQVEVEGAVVGCKCMGKCKEGPNVRIVTHRKEGGASDREPSLRNPLCIGVGLEDVGTIVSNYFGKRSLGI